MVKMLANGLNALLDQIASSTILGVFTVFVTFLPHLDKTLESHSLHTTPRLQQKAVKQVKTGGNPR